MRRLLLVLSLALVALDVGTSLVGRRAEQAVVHSEISASVTAPGHERTTYKREIFPSPAEAADEFDEQLRQAADYKEFSPCFDGDGRRTGLRAVILLLPPHARAPTWRIVWTYRAENYSQLFTVESVSEKDARHYEEIQGQGPHDVHGWKSCATRHQ